MLTCEDLLADIFTWRQQYCHLDCYIAGDFNANLNDTDNAVVKCINNFICSLSLSCADLLFPNAGNFTDRSFSILSQCTRLSDRQTDGQRDRHNSFECTFEMQF